MKFCKFLFYKFYYLSEYIGSGDSSSKINAWTNTTVLLAFNVFSIGFIIEIYLKKRIVNEFNGGSIWLITGLLVYYTSVYNNSYLVSIEQFSTISTRNRRISSVALMLYFLFSFVIFFYLYDLHQNPQF